MRVDWLQILYGALILGVGIALALSWARLRSLRPLLGFGEKTTVTWLLILTTISFVFFLLSFPFQDAILGTAFSEQRSIVLYINLGLTLSVAIVSIFRGGTLKWRIVCAALALLLVWLIVAAIGSAV